MAAFHTVLLLLCLIAGLPGALSGSSMAALGYNDNWTAGHATWYGDAQGEGSSGGACGYTKLTGTPYTASIAAGSAAIFQNGKGCGQCYEVKCSYSICKSETTRVVITDSCPGGNYCSTGEPAFDLSGAAISSMAPPGKDETFGGLYNILYKRVPCKCPNQNIAFKIDAGSSAYWLSLTVKYQGGLEILKASPFGSFVAPRSRQCNTSGVQTRCLSTTKENPSRAPLT